MTNPKDILVVTTSVVEGRSVKKHIKPITAHIVAGTNVFSDFAASFTDVFGGRSGTYQKQISSLYDEAIAKIKLAAFELGANCVVGLSIDMDEISGKGKAMFMLTAIGTAVVIEDVIAQITPTNTTEKFENVSYERINVLHNKKEMLRKANENQLGLGDESWKFITENQFEEIFPFLLKKYHPMSISPASQGDAKAFYEKMTAYIDTFSEDKKKELLYQSALAEDSDTVLQAISNMIKDLQLLDFNLAKDLVQHTDFKKQKLGLQIVTHIKPFYNKEDLALMGDMVNYIQNNFKERGTLTTKKQMLSSKEKEVWVCECGKTNDVQNISNSVHCDSCNKDIYGFKPTDVTPVKTAANLRLKMDLISELIN